MGMLMQTWYWMKRTLALLALIAGLVHIDVAKADIVTLTGAFGQYHGAVGNGLVFGTQWQTIMNGTPVGPTEAIPGLEDSFTPPDPNDPSSLGQGLGFTTQSLGDVSSIDFYTSSFHEDIGAWLNDTDNFLGFTAGPAANVTKGIEFLLGTFSLANGIFWAASPYHDFTFSITTHSDNPDLDGHVFSDTVRLVITPNCFVQPACHDAGYTAEKNADYFYFTGHSDLGTMSVYELQDSPTGSNFGSIDLYGKIGSLTPTKFANPTGGVFVGPAVVIAPVPEPSGWILMGAGLIGVISLKRKRP